MIISRHMQRFRRNQQGIAFVEFALTFPILLGMVYGMIEVTRYILITQKAEKLAHTIADLTAQSQDVTTADLNIIMEASAHVMEPHTTGSNSRVIISSLYRPPNPPSPAAASTARVNWCFRGGGTLTSSSRIGELNATPTMPGGFTFVERENVISAEVFYRFSPIITTRFFGTRTIYRAAFYKPRLGQLTTASVSCS